MVLRQMPSRPQEKFLTIREFGAIGNGISFAMGVAAARPDRTVVLFDGDGSLLMHVQELEAIKRSRHRALDRCVMNDGAVRLARRDPQPDAQAHQGGRSRQSSRSGSGGVPVWSHDGIICTGETYKSVVKLTFAKGASLKDPSSLFNSSLDGNTRRAIDFHEGEKINEKALQDAHSRRRHAEQVSQELIHRDGKQASDDDRRIHPGRAARGPAAPAPALRDPQERRAGRGGSDQVGQALLRRAPVPVCLLRAQGALQLRANRGGAGAFRKELQNTRRPRISFRFPTTSPCQRI